MTSPSVGDFIAAACSLGVELLDSSRVLPDGSITWHRGFGVGFEKVEDAGIFNGRIGEALFLASAGRADPASGLQEYVPRVLDPLCRRLRSRTEVRRLASELRFGLTGIGSIVYALKRISDLLGEPGYQRIAEIAVEHVTPEVLEIDDRYEIYWGVSGWLLGCLALTAGDSSIGLSRASEAAAFLLSRRVLDPAGKLKVWPTEAGRPTGGFAHGNSGIAHALLQYALYNPDEQIYTAAIRAFDFERHLFNPEVGDWADIPGQKRPLMTSWCHGAPGIVMARLSAVAVLRPDDEPDVAADLRAGLIRTSQIPLIGTHSLCCGSMGRADCLLTASRVLGNASLAEAAEPHARNALDAILGRRLITGRSGDTHQHGGLWQGVSGIGYQLLRFADPECFPSVLRLDRLG